MGRSEDVSQPQFAEATRSHRLVGGDEQETFIECLTLPFRAGCLVVPGVGDLKPEAVAGWLHARRRRKLMSRARVTSMVPLLSS